MATIIQIYDDYGDIEYHNVADLLENYLSQC